MSAGCSYLYDPDKLSARPEDAPSPADASADALVLVPDAVAVDARPQPDVDPDVLAVFTVTPQRLLEGAGANRAIPVVVFGQNFSPDAVVTITGPDGLPIDGLEIVDSWVVSSDQQDAALSLELPVITDCGAEEMVPLKLTVTQGSDSTQADLELRCLPELTLAGSYVTEGPDPVFASTLAIDPGGVRIIGAHPARFVAMRDITVEGIINADAQGGSGGPGGCAGGGDSQNGGCGDGGGQLGGSQGGGGGGGYGTPGTDGAGSGGEPGLSVGNEMLVPISGTGLDRARGNGGGGGDGKGGGGGGGVVELTAHGTITISTTGGITANGGNGANGGGLIGGLCTAGGGGGSGGAVLLRSFTAITAPAGSGSIAADPGSGGDPFGSCGGGGDGGYGRVRFDSPEPVAEGVVSALVPLARGPMWGEVPPISLDGTLMVEVSGDPSVSYGLVINDGEEETVSVSDAPVAITLTREHNTLCLLAKPGASLEQSEAKNCLTVAYISQ